MKKFKIDNLFILRKITAVVDSGTSDRVSEVLREQGTALIRAKIYNFLILTHTSKFVDLIMSKAHDKMIKIKRL